jgi:hypothetical protein
VRRGVAKKFSAHTAVDNLVHNPVEICAARAPPPRAALARAVDASFLSIGGAAWKTAASGLGGMRCLR